MKWIRFCSAVVAMIGLSASAQAGIFGLGGGCGAAKSCGCDAGCQPACCKPTITKPCDLSVHTYQRKCSDIKPPCCDTACAPTNCCKPATKPCDCGKPVACAKSCAPAACAKPCAPAACAKPAPCCNTAKACDCAKPAAGCCAADSCCETRCCNADPCEVAKLIYESQTCCYAKDRRRAIHKLGDNYDCVCNPEIMVAFIYALNDADERVRWKAADEIGDQLRKNDCCCTPEVVAALTCALADCDRGVRHQAQEGLECCGYEVVDGCCDTGCDGCTPAGCGPATAPAAPKAAPAPAPPADPKAYFPSRLRQKQASRSTSRHSLAGLFGFLD